MTLSFTLYLLCRFFMTYKLQETLITLRPLSLPILPRNITCIIQNKSSKQNENITILYKHEATWIILWTKTWPVNNSSFLDRVWCHWWPPLTSTYPFQELKWQIVFNANKRWLATPIILFLGIISSNLITVVFISHFNLNL